MSDQPLHPFSPPSAILNQLHLPNFLGALSGGTIIVWVLYVVFAFWALYTLVAIYHWLKYSHASLLAIPAIAVHIIISITLMSYALSAQTSSFFSTLTSYLP